MSFGDLLRELRRAAGLTQRQLAERAGVSAGAIRDLEQGRTHSPKPASVAALAAALGLSPADAERLQQAARARPAARHPLGTGGGGGCGGPLRIGVLGPLEVWHGDRRARLGSGLQRTLLARLALTPGATAGQDELIELLWPDGAAHARAASLLHTHVTRLRRLLECRPGGAGVLLGGGGGYRLAVGAEELDVLRFRELIAQAAYLAPEEALARLEQALELWRGAIDVPPLAASPELAALEAEHVAAVCRHAALARDVGRPERALPRVRELALRPEHELDEPLHAELVLTLAASGRQAEALAAYEAVRAALAAQLGIDPGEQLRQAQLAVLRRREAQARRTMGRTAIQQAPAVPPDFVGRDGELAAIEAALPPHERRQDAVPRIVLIDGIAGVGKTALALAAAHRLRERYPDGQLYADLRGTSAAAPEPMRVLGRFLRALGVPSRQIGTDDGEAAALLRSELADRRMLVLLDDARDAGQVLPLLPGSGGSDLIVTSRRRMPGLAGACNVHVEPLNASESVELIAATAGAERVRADPAAAEALAEACARLPLALRIASARLATRQAWTIGDLTRRLHDDNRRLAELATGESSVLASFQLGYAGLGPAARRAFRLCSLHPADDFGAGATAALLGLPEAEAERVLEELLEANMLLQYAADRYRFHDLLGLYARRLLAGDAEAGQARSRLHAWYAETVTAAMEWVYPQLVRLGGHPRREAVFAGEEQALAWLDVELPALVAIVRQAAGSADPAPAWRITDQLRGYFLIRRHVDGWLPAAQAGLRAADSAGDEAARTAMLISRGQALWSVGRDEEALADYVAGERLAAATGWSAAAAYLAHHIGWLRLEQGRLAEAERWLRRALERTEDDPLAHVRSVAVNGLGVLRLCQGELGEAAELFTAALQINQRTGRQTSALANQGNLASALRRLGEEERAFALLEEALAAYRRAANMRGELSTLDELALWHLQRGQAGAGLAVARRAHEMAIAVHDRKATAQTAATVARAYLALGDAGTAAGWYERCLAIAHRTYPFVEARALAGLGAVRLEEGDAQAARGLAGQAAAIAAACGFRGLERRARAVLAACEAGALIG